MSPNAIRRGSSELDFRVSTSPPEENEPTIVANEGATVIDIQYVSPGPTADDSIRREDIPASGLIGRLVLHWVVGWHRPDQINLQRDFPEFVLSVTHDEPV